MSKLKSESKQAGQQEDAHAVLTEKELGTFRTKHCDARMDGDCENYDRCSYSHCITWQRRNPFEVVYSAKLCPDISFSRNGAKMSLIRKCNRGKNCKFAHSKEEELYHPLAYKTKLCTSFPNCNRYFCPFAHSKSEIRHPRATETVSKEKKKPSKPEPAIISANPIPILQEEQTTLNSNQNSEESKMFVISEEKILALIDAAWTLGNQMRKDHKFQGGLMSLKDPLATSLMANEEAANSAENLRGLLLEFEHENSFVPQQQQKKRLSNQSTDSGSSNSNLSFMASMTEDSPTHHELPFASLMQFPSYPSYPPDTSRPMDCSGLFDDDNSYEDIWEDIVRQFV